MVKRLCPADATDLIMKLLTLDSSFRLGTGGSHEVKEHPFFFEYDWGSLLRQKAEFVPQLEGEEDTSYFDCEYDRELNDLNGEGEWRTSKSGSIALSLRCIGACCQSRKQSLFPSWRERKPLGILTVNRRKGLTKCGGYFFSYTISESFIGLYFAVTGQVGRGSPLASTP